MSFRPVGISKINLIPKFIKTSYFTELRSELELTIYLNTSGLGITRQPCRMGEKQTEQALMMQ